jgi:hypothetical protein
MICPRCKRWEVLDEDLYCSWCKLTLSDFELSLDIDQLYVGDPLLDPLELRIKHTGALGQIQIKEIVTDQPWARLAGEGAGGLTLRSGGSITLPVEVEPLEMSDDYHQAIIEARSNIGTRSTTLDIVPRPEIHVFTGEYTVLLDMISEDKDSGYIEVTRGALTVKGLTTDVSWARVELLDGVQFPCHLDARLNNRLDFKFVFDNAQLINETEGSPAQAPIEHQGHLVLNYVELTIDRRESFRVKTYMPPLLVIPEEIGQTVRLDVFLGKRKELDITLQNGDRDVGGRAELRIFEIAIDQEWLRPIAAIAYPIAVASGGYHQIGFLLVADEVGEGIHAAKISLLTNLPAPNQQRDLFVVINVQRMGDFEGTVAIDFGTTNSCCAVLDEFGRQFLIDIDNPDSNPKPTTAPSTIIYWDKAADSSREFEIGKRAYILSSHSETEPSTVTQVKRMLGRAETVPVTFYRDPTKRADLVPREIARDILKRILERAEETLGSRIVRCTISHPSRFSLRQIDDLKAALASSGIRGQITTIPEPVAAALSFIQRPEVIETRQEYHLMVFDFGGGTTDITLMNVVNEYDQEREVYVVRPKVLGANGNNWFGGEDVTDIVMEIARRKCYDWLTQQLPDAANIVIPLDRKKFEKTQYRTLAANNRGVLRAWAEASKIALAEFGDEHTDLINGFRSMSRSDLDIQGIRLALQDGLKLGVIIDGAVKEGEQFSHVDVVPRLQELEDRLRPRLEELSEMMRDLASHHGVREPEIILLSGKSSAFKLVRDVISKTFPEPSTIEHPDDLKECVVRGASLLSSRLISAGVEIDLVEPMTTTTSRLGIRVNEAGHVKFKGFVEAGVPIPPGGLHGPIKGLGRLHRHNVISILENTGLRDELVVEGQDNREIRELRSYLVERTLKEWEEKHNTQIADKDIAQAHIEFEISPSLNVKVRTALPGFEEAIEFGAELD